MTPIQNIGGAEVTSNIKMHQFSPQIIANIFSHQKKVTRSKAWVIQLAINKIILTAELFIHYY